MLPKFWSFEIVCYQAQLVYIVTLHAPSVEGLILYDIFLESFRLQVPSLLHFHERVKKSNRDARIFSVL